MTAAVIGCKTSRPSLIIKEKIGEEVEIFLICEQTIITQVTGLEAPIALLAAYYAFNMQYPKGLQSFCTLLEVMLCGVKPGKVPNVSSALIGLQ